MTFPTAAAMTTRRSSLVERLGAVIAPPSRVWVRVGETAAMVALTGAGRQHRNTATALPQTHRPEHRSNRRGGVMAVSGDPQHAASLFGDCRRRAVVAPQRAQVDEAPVRHPEKPTSEREASGIGPVGLAHSHDAAEIVDVVGATGPSPEGPQIDHPGLV